MFARTRRPLAASWWLVAAVALAVGAVALAPSRAGCAAPPSAASALAEARTAHVRVRGDVDAALLKAFAELAESAWPHWKAYFRAEPPKGRGPLELLVRAKREDFLADVHAIGVTGDLGGAGGWSSPATRTSYLYLQPHESSTRLLVLHEATHQYEYQAVLDDRSDRGPSWHTEGVAEHFGFHRRTKAGLVVGALDMVAIDDRPQQCADRVRTGGFDAWAVGTGAKASDYTDAMTLFETFFRTKDAKLRAAFRAWEEDVYRAGDPGRRFAKAFKGERARLDAAVREVWGAFHRPWGVEFVAWDEDADGVVARSGSWALLRGAPIADGPRKFVEATVAFGPGATAAGLGLGMRGPNDLLLAQLDPSGAVELRVRRGGSWTSLASGAIGRAATAAPVALRLEARGLDVVLTSGSTTLLRAEGAAAELVAEDLVGGAALSAEGGEVRFRAVSAGG